MLRLPQEQVDLVEPPPRQDALPARPAVARGEPAQQRDLELGPRREVGMTSLAGEDHGAISDLRDRHLAEPGPGRDDRTTPGRARPARLELGDPFRREQVQGPGERLEIVHEHDLTNAQHARELARVDHPRQVGRHDAAFRDRDRRSRWRRPRAAGRGARETRGGAPSGCPRRSRTSRTPRARGGRRPIEQPEPRVRPPDVPGQDHRAPGLSPPASGARRAGGARPPPAGRRSRRRSSGSRGQAGATTGPGWAS